MKLLKGNWGLVVISIICCGFFLPFFSSGKLPIPADDLVGLYHPWRDAMYSQYPNGYPFKNPLITDPVRQQYPYRIRAIEQLIRGQLPQWNPYSFSGTPLFANIQTAALYPLNIFFLFLPARLAWSFLVFLQLLLSGVFMYVYLQNLKLREMATCVGAIAFAFSGFMIAWLEWNTIGHVVLWLPLILLAKDKLIFKRSWSWAVVLIFAQASAFLAGHLQTFLYMLVFSTVYLFVRIYQQVQSQIPKKSMFKAYCSHFGLFALTGTCVILLTSIQWVPSLKFIFDSARNFDLAHWVRPDWFIPWQHALQFVIPDFFGNPATGNYWGVWNYGEFVGYIGLVPLTFAFFAVIARRDKKTLFYALSLGISLLLAFPTFIGKLPYQLQIPFISTMQPSRILVLIDFCLAVLAAFGIDYFLQKKAWSIMVFSSAAVSVGFLSIWIVVIAKLFPNASITERNLFMPTALVGILLVYVFIIHIVKKQKLFQLATLVLLLATFFDVWRFSTKFTPFTDATLLYPQTKTITFLQQNLGNYRFMTTDRRLFPPNVSAFYKLASVDGYDPLYLFNYGQIAATWTRNKADISPAAFNRIVTPENSDSFLADLLGVKYILSLKELNNPKLKLVFSEGQTKVYENTKVYPRAFFVSEIIHTTSSAETMQKMFEHSGDLRSKAFTEGLESSSVQPLGEGEQVTIVAYEENMIQLKTTTTSDRLVVLTDIFYSSWKATIDGIIPVQIVPVDLSLRGIVVPKGIHTITLRI